MTELFRPKKSRSRALAMQKRKHVNRIMMQKRRHERVSHMLIPRLSMVAFILQSLIIVIASCLGGAAFTFYQSQLPLLDGIARHSLFQTTHIYDRNGKLLYQLYDHGSDTYGNPRGRRTYVNFGDIPTVLVNSTVAAEDHSFWTNSGVDMYGILRAVVTDFQHGVPEQGGSTVTQQLIKNQFFLKQNRNLQMKGEEALLAVGLTQRYSKAQIMEMYLNTVFYGDSNFGIEAAAQDFFGLSPQCDKHGQCKPAVAQLTLGEASLLAGLPQSPTTYMPFYNRQSALKRQEHVLNNMVALNMITPSQSQAARQEMKTFKFKRPPSVKNAPHFVDYIVDQVLIPLFGAQNLVDGGYSIYTTIDLNLERKVESITYNRIYGNTPDMYGYTNLRVAHNLNNAAVVVTDPLTGEILTMNGSVNYNDTSDDPRIQGQFNSAADALRQPGSSFKPIVYATALEMGWYPAMNVPDAHTYFPDGILPYEPHNYDRMYHGATGMSVRRAISNSYNIPAVEALEFAGIPNVLTTASRLGLPNVASTPHEYQGAAMALGTSVESLLNMTTAYATFANQGVRMPQTTVLQINNNLGKPIYKFDPQKVQGKRVLGQDVAFLMSSILSDTNARHEEFGPGNPLELDRPVAAKTGTTDSFDDNWTLGYTPYLAVGVWAGNSDNTPMNNVIGITGAGPIWHDVMVWANQHYHFPVADFIPPVNVHKAAVSASTGLLPHVGESTVKDWFIDGTVPTIQGPYYIPPVVPRVTHSNPDKASHSDNNSNDDKDKDKDKDANSDSEDDKEPDNK